jgi:hypothetical protein
VAFASVELVLDLSAVSLTVWTVPVAEADEPILAIVARMVRSWSVRSFLG